MHQTVASKRGEATHGLMRQIAHFETCSHGHSILARVTYDAKGQICQQSYKPHVRIPVSCQMFITRCQMLWHTLTHAESHKDVGQFLPDGQTSSGSTQEDGIIKGKVLRRRHCVIVGLYHTVGEGS